MAGLEKMKSSPFNLEGKIALLTGAGGYLGQAMATGLAQNGAHVILNGRDRTKLETLCKAICCSGGTASISAFDVSDCYAVQRALQEIGTKFGRLDILVNNAYHGGGGTLAHSSKEDFLSSFDVAVASAAELVREALPLLEASISDGGASVINIASMYGLVSPDQRVYETPQGTNPPFYGTAKAALIQLTRYLACELGARNIRVNAIAPGPFPSMSVQVEQAEFVERLVDRVPLARIGKASEIAGPVVFLASDAASFVTGSVLSVDGGWTSW